MKLTKTSRVTAMILALLMIVPLISVPAFAEDSATGKVYYSQDFTGVTDARDAVSYGTYNTAPSIKDVGGAHGNVFYYDLVAGMTDVNINGDGVDALYLAPNNSTVYKVISYEQGDNGYSGKVTISGTEYAFTNATLNTDKPSTKTTLTKVSDSTAYETQMYLVTPAVRASWIGGNAIASKQNAKHDTIASSKVTYSADYYFDAALQGAGETHLMNGTFRLLGFTFGSSNVTITAHGDNLKKNEDGSKINDFSGSAITKPVNTWINISVVVDYSTGYYTIYVDGVEGITTNEVANLAKVQAVAGNIPADNWNLVQINRNGNGVSTRTGFVMVDNAVIYEGEVLPAAADCGYEYVETFDSGKAGSTLQTGIVDKYSNATIVDGSSYGERDGKVLEIDLGENTDPSVQTNTIINKGGAINPGYSYNTGRYLAISSDFFIPNETIVQLQLQQIHAYTANGSQQYWLSFGTIYAKTPNEDVTFGGGNTGFYQKTYTGTMKRNTWNTITSVVDLVTGSVNQYLNGELARTFSLKFGNIEFNAGNLLMVKVNNSTTSYYPNGYKGKVAFDNLGIRSVDLPTGEMNDFTNLTDFLMQNYSTISNVSIAEGTAYGKLASDKVLEVNLTNYLTTNTAPADVAGTVAHRHYTAEGDEHMVIQQDLYIPTGTEVQLQSQLNQITSSTVEGTKGYVSLWVIYAKSDGKITLDNEYGWGTNAETTANSMGRDTWNTITTDIDLVTGHVCIYINGILARQFDLAFRTTVDGVETFTVFENMNVEASSTIVAKMNKPVSCIGTFPNGFKGAYAFDNVGVYSSLDAAKAAHSGVYENRFFNIDYEDADENTHATATVSPFAIFADYRGPASATYTKIEDNTVVKIDMKHSTETNDELINGGPNTDKMFTVPHPALTYRPNYPELNEVVYSANYFFSTNSNGIVESQINSDGWYLLYQFNCGASTFTVGDASRKFEKNKWNNVTMIVKIGAEATTFDIYLNGIFVSTLSYKIGLYTANSWSVAKVMKDEVALKDGYFYVDNISGAAYDATLAGEVDLDQVVTYTSNGITSVNTLRGKVATYDATVTTVTAEDYFKENVLLNTLDVASIRLTSPSGLRFATKVDAKVLAAIEALGMKVTEMGTLIAPETYGTLDLENFVAYEDGKEVTAKTILKVVAGEYNTALGFDTDDTTHHFVGSIVDIQEYTRVFSGRGYMTVTLPNGNSYNVYSAYTKSISVKDQAQATLDADTEKTLYPVGTDNYNILAGFAGIQQ